MIDKEQATEIRRQIGMNILAISGGRTKAIDNGIEMPCGAGYRVRVVLDPSDTYTVSRVFKRGGKEFPKGSRSNVYCDEVSEVAYFASCFRSYDENEWMSKA
jgi:hypothetical protein